MTPDPVPPSLSSALGPWRYKGREFADAFPTMNKTIAGCPLAGGLPSVPPHDEVCVTRLFASHAETVIHDDYLSVLPVAKGHGDPYSAARRGPRDELGHGCRRARVHLGTELFDKPTAKTKLEIAQRICCKIVLRSHLGVNAIRHLAPLGSCRIGAGRSSFSPGKLPP